MPPSPTFRPVRGVLAGGHAATLRAGRRALEAGGNAWDAAAAALLASFVAEPCMSSPGGGLLATVLEADGRALALDAFCATPRRWRPEGERDFRPVTVDFGSTTETFHAGWASVAVPGALAGLDALAGRGRLPRAELVAPALALAREGCAVDRFQAYDFRLLEGILRLDRAAAAPFFGPDDRPLGEGRVQRLPGLADFLEAWSREGPGWWAAGEPGAALEALMRERGGQLDRADLRAYRVAWREPLRAAVHGWALHTAPAPSAGGSVLALTLALLEDTGEPGPAGFATALAGALREAHAARRDPAGMAPETRAALAALAGEHVFAGGGTPPAGGTTHFSVLDEEGRCVALSVSNGEGSGCWLPGTQVQLNNMLGEAALFPAGFHRGPNGARVSSLMAPTVARRGAFRLALGSGGAGRIPSALAAVLYRVAALGTDPAEAVAAPRLHEQGGELHLEPGLPAGALPPGHRVRVWQGPDMFFGGVHAVWQDGPHRHAVADARRFGSTDRCDGGGA